ncbi:MAG: prepilin-type N-terminal cleavage/methylation domain-containing protein [Patescibacteria group bacterium]
MKYPNNKKGFTLIELLVVISIIGLLSSMAIYAINSARLKAKATRIIGDFKTIEKALILLMDEENPGKWWREGEKSTNLTYFAGLSEFLNRIPEPPITGEYSYDNDGDTLVEPDDSCCRGVNIGIGSCGNDCFIYFNLVDGIIDNSDGRSYGKVRSNSSYDYIYYNICINENTF